MVINNNNYVNINKVAVTRTTAQKSNTRQTNNDFGRILEDKIKQNSPLKFSKHAELRLSLRNINLSATQMDRINMAVKKAEEKGVNESLVIMDDIALIVNIKNRTVITAVSKNELKENVFTNIDGAVIV